MNEFYNTQEVSDKAVDTSPFVFDSVPDWYMTEKICDKVVSKEPFMLKYGLLIMLWLMV